MKELKELVDVSHVYGNDKDFVIAGGGNTSYKNDHYIWVKASGTSMANLTEKEFVKLDRKKLRAINNLLFSDDPNEREEQVKSALLDAVIDEGRGLRPSVETSLHESIDYAFVVHTHPHKVNSLLCGKNSKQRVDELFGDDVLYIPYTDPGYTLYQVVLKQLKHYRETKDAEPNIIFIENHGVFVAADTVEEIEMFYAQLMDKIDENIEHQLPDSKDLPIDEKARKVLPAIRMLLSDNTTKIVRIRNNALISYFAESQSHFRNIALPFTPDIIVYCKAKYIYLETTGSADDIINHLRAQLERFVREYGYKPRIILIRGLGLIAVENSSQSAETVLDIYEDLMKISYQSASFGGPRFLTPDQISFIDSWEVEHYRRKVASKSSTKNKHLIDQKIVIITGGAQGFGAGIARKMFSNGANVVIADIDVEKGRELVDYLNEGLTRNNAFFVKTNVADPNDVANAVFTAVCQYGGLDVMISNAGILRAGGLNEIDSDTFDQMTDINYKGYFLCTKYSAEIMQVQHEFKSGYFMDIIQINSKSGLKGSNRNFTYAGGKFGGLGLTQSFALELIPDNIKVNAICPGNYFEGPLWSDSQKGLFVQYLNTGKVHGAKSIDDVRKHYESQVPMKRGCKVDDVLKAIYYVIDQKYETGQAIPVTGGQIMLS